MVELQGTGESRPFTRSEMNELIDLADGGIRDLFAVQRSVLAAIGVTVAAPQPEPAS
jgi:ribonuclease PH